MSDTWRIRLQQLEVRNADEDDFWSNGDEPYFVTIGFRSKFQTPGSTQIVWSGHLDDDWASGIDGGGKRAIPTQMGLAEFPNVRIAKISAGEMPEIVGAIVLSFESDATPFSVMAAKMREVEGEIKKHLVQLVEQGQINLANPQADIDKAVKEIRDTLAPSWREAIAVWLSSFGDPDDLVGLKPLVFVAIPPGTLPGIPALAPGRLDLSFTASGIDYRVTGQVERQPGQQTTGRAFVNVVSRSLDKLDVFLTGSDGRVRTAAWSPSSNGWQGWSELRGGLAAPGAAVTGVSRSTDRLDVFVVGTDNGTYTAAFAPGTGWQGWWNLRGGIVAPGAPITAVSRAKDKLDVFCVGTDGHVYTAAWEPSFTDGWRGWWRVGDVKAPVGAYVGAVSRGLDKLDIFVTDVNGRIMTTAWAPGSNWQAWSHLRGGLAKPGSPVTAVSRSTDKADVFVVGTDGSIFTAARSSSGWQGWWRIRDAKAPLGSYVGAVSRGTDKLDVFVTDVNGLTMTASWEPTFTDGWRGWWRIKTGKAQPGAPITAVSRRPDHLDVFVVGLDNLPWTAAWSPSSGGWQGWWHVGG